MEKKTFSYRSETWTRMIFFQQRHLCWNGISWDEESRSSGSCCKVNWAWKFLDTTWLNLLSFQKRTYFRGLHRQSRRFRVGAWRMLLQHWHGQASHQMDGSGGAENWCKYYQRWRVSNEFFNNFLPAFLQQKRHLEFWHFTMGNLFIWTRSLSANRELTFAFKWSFYSSLLSVLASRRSHEARRNGLQDGSAWRLSHRDLRHDASSMGSESNQTTNLPRAVSLAATLEINNDVKVRKWKSLILRWKQKSWCESKGRKVKNCFMDFM